MMLSEELAKLAELHKNGHLTEEEYAAAKQQVLNAAAPVPEAEPVLDPDPVPIVTPVPRPTPTSPWGTAVIQSQDGMSDAYFKAKYRRNLSLVPFVLMVVTLFSFCGSFAMGADAVSRAGHRADWERIAMVSTAVLWAMSLLGLCIWSLSDPFRAGIAAIGVILLVGVLSTLFTALDVAAESDELAPRDVKALGSALLVGWVIRFAVVVTLVWGVVDARHVRRYVRKPDQVDPGTD
jgi:hypothetical protein